jgi:fatty acid desaturase
MGTCIATSDNLAKDLQAAIADLYQIDPHAGLLRFLALGAVFLSLTAVAWSVTALHLFVAIAVVAGFFYAFWTVCSHDSVHQTLTGWQWFERISPRLVTWPMLWPYGTYATLHRLHHGWNGIDLRDPERVQWTVEEYQMASPLLRWYVRHQWILDIFVLGGIGLILKTLANAWKFRDTLPKLRSQFWIDLTGILVIQGSLLAFFSCQGEIIRYLLFWLILERTAGAIVQARDHLEHYGMWGQTDGYQLTQLYSCRNLTTYPWVGWLMGGLDYHAVHHAFPNIPFNRLPEAFQRIQSVLQRHGLPPMLQGGGYVRELLNLSQHLSAIDAVNPQDRTGRCRMVSVS